MASVQCFSNMVIIFKEIGIKFLVIITHKIMNLLISLSKMGQNHFGICCVLLSSGRFTAQFRFNQNRKIDKARQGMWTLLYVWKYGVVGLECGA